MTRRQIKTDWCASSVYIRCRCYPSDLRVYLHETSEQPFAAPPQRDKAVLPSPLPACLAVVVGRVATGVSMAVVDTERA